MYTYPTGMKFESDLSSSWDGRILVSLKSRTFRNDSSHDLLKELEEVRKEKSSLEKQLNNFLTSKTSQTPPTTLALVDDLDRCEKISES